VINFQMKKVHIMVWSWLNWHQRSTSNKSW